MHQTWRGSQGSADAWRIKISRELNACTRGVFGCLHLRVLASRDAGSCCLVAVSQVMRVRALCLVACM
jgi:hypothetical protein